VYVIKVHVARYFRLISGATNFIIQICSLQVQAATLINAALRWGGFPRSTIGHSLKSTRVRRDGGQLVHADNPRH
jgi:hypothetical protein